MNRRSFIGTAAGAVAASALPTVQSDAELNALGRTNTIRVLPKSPKVVFGKTFRGVTVHGKGRTFRDCNFENCTIAGFMVLEGAGWFRGCRLTGTATIAGHFNDLGDQ